MNVSLNKESMKYSVGYAVVALLFVLTALPGVVMAQATSTSSTATSSIRSFYPDGSVQSGSVRRQRIQGYRKSSDVQQKISALSSTSSAAVLMPVLFGVEVKDISSNFGDPRDGGTRTHVGEDIMAVKGTPIVSPTQAVVLRTVTGADEGNAVYTANPGGETFVYMHLDHFGEGVVSGLVLSQGSLIGYVGNTGNASGGPAHLHFEIHNSSGTPVDPFPRLSAEFSLQEKISYLSTILLQTSDSTALARFLVTNFRGVFILALTSNITLPVPIADALASIPPATSASASNVGVIPAGDLDIGSSGVLVVALQKYLIQAATGAAAARLAAAGATGYFGLITKAALMEYQVSVGISPPSGYYGSITRSFIAARPLGTVSPPAPNSSTTGGSTVAFTRDLSRTMSGEDVRTLQRVLNANGYAVAPTGLDLTGSPRAGSLGNETTYFGAATEAAVIRFQIARGIAPAVGYVGPLTRAALASL